MRFGTAGIPSCVSGDTVRGVKGVSDLGLSAMEISFTHGVYMKAPLAFETGKVARDNGVKLSVHAPYYINLLGKKEIVKNSQQRILDCARMAGIMKASPVVVHAGYGDNTKKIVRALEPILEKIEEESIETKIGLETSGKQKQWGTLEEILKVCSEIDVVPVLDFAHLYARSNGGLRTQKNYLNVFEKIMKTNPQFLFDLHIHFSNVEFKNGNEIAHIPIDKSPPFKPLAKVLLKLGLEATLISETPTPEVGAVKMREIVNQLRN